MIEGPGTVSTLPMGNGDADNGGGTTPLASGRVISGFAIDPDPKNLI